MSPFTVLVIGASAATFVATGGYALVPQEFYDPSCNIKGNVSIHSGERIYHLPEQQDYAATIIRSQYGERWFCSETDAVGAGWRKAGR